MSDAKWDNVFSVPVRSMSTFSPWSSTFSCLREKIRNILSLPLRHSLTGECLSISIFPAANSLSSDSGKAKPIQRIPEGQKNPLSVSLMLASTKTTNFPPPLTPQIDTFNTETQTISLDFKGGGGKYKDLISFPCCDTVMLHAARSFS